MRRLATMAATLLALAALLPFGCGRSSAPGAGGRGIRVVSLAPSLTEIAYAIGCGPQLVADTTYDDYPPRARSLPHVADLSNVDVEKIAALAPTAVMALHDQEKAGGQISRALPGVMVSYLPNRNLSDLFDDVVGAGKICGRDAQARALAESLRNQLGSVSRAAARNGRKPRVLYLLGLPGFTVGRSSFLSDLIARAGGVNVAGSIAQPYPNLSAERILALDPDVVIVAHDTPFGPDVRAREPWRSLRAVRAGLVRVPPNDDIMERAGPRIVDGLRWLAAAIRS